RVGILVAGHVDERGGAASARRDQIGEFDRRGNGLLGIENRRQLIEPDVRNLRNTDRGVALAARRVFRARHQLEQGRLSGRGETYQCGVEHEQNIISFRLLTLSSSQNFDTPSNWWRNKGVTPN